MKVSVIVPVYNVEEYLEKCLDSLVNQTLEDIEILVVNDGSPDGSQDIIDKYEKKYSDKIRSFQKENGGQASARNYALEHVRGEYIGFVDSDDWVDLQMYEEMYNEAQNTDADIVLCNTIDHYSDYDVYHRQTDVGKFRKCGSACNKIFRTSFLGEVRFPSGLWYEDFSFTTRLLMLTNKIGKCEQHFYHALTRECSTMNNNNSKKNLDIIEVFKGIISFAKEKNIYEKYSYDIEYMVLEHILITSINRVAVQKNDIKKDIVRQLRQYVLEQYPKFYKDSVFQEFTTNQKVVARLNAKGLEQLSQQLFKLKSKINRR